MQETKEKAFWFGELYISVVAHKEQSRRDIVRVVQKFCDEVSKKDVVIQWKSLGQSPSTVQDVL